MKLGKKSPRLDARTLHLAKYLTRELPPAPPTADWGKGLADWGMLANDKLGDCTIAAVGHAVQLFTMNQWGLATITDATTVDYYSRWCGYNPADPSTDQGGVEVDVLNRWRAEGFGSDPNHLHRLIAYADTDPENIEHVKLSISIFGCAYIGLALPVSAQNQEEWHVVRRPWWDSYPGSWGGHAVIVYAYDEEGLTCVTWGKPKRMTWGFWKKYCDESHALLHRGWYPPGFNAQQLEADLEALSR